MSPVSRRTSLLALGLATLAACAGGAGNGNAVDLGPVEDAVESSTPRVVKVTTIERMVDGLGHAISMELRVDGGVPMSADDLDAIVSAIWLTVPWEPNGISLTAFADDAESQPVDLRAAADELTPMFSASFAEGGTSLIGMPKRYGEWKKPT